MDGDTALTARELEVLDCFKSGLKRGQIARKLSRSPKTIDAHRANIMEKMKWDGFAFERYLRAASNVTNLAQGA